MTCTAAERRVAVRPPGSERPRYGLLAGLALGLLPAELDQSIFATALPAVVAELGGYGGVVQALRHGVPLVVAGRSEDKPEVAVRVAWSGAGLNLRTDRPTQARLRRPVRTRAGPAVLSRWRGAPAATDRRAGRPGRGDRR